MEKDLDNWGYFWKLGRTTVKELETEEGILASGKNELYGAIFGRDSLITSLKLLKVYQQTKEKDFLNIVKKVLITLCNLQGKEINIESGEEPGKCIHEYRPEKHEHLTASKNPWYLYPDKVMRSYDSVDATPLLLIALYRYWQVSQDQKFINSFLPNCLAALNWLEVYGDSNGDGFIDYGLNPARKFGGLLNQNWMDSEEATFHEDGEKIIYPIAPVEAQAYAYLAFRLWAKFFEERDNEFSERLFSKAYLLKKRFNKRFFMEEEKAFAFGVDGSGKLLKSIRSNQGHALWASLTLGDEGETESIVERDKIELVVKRLLAEDIFEKEAGIRTLSKNSVAFSPNSYHNGSIWPHDNSMIAEGFENFGYLNEAWQVRKAILKAISHFQNPIELFVYDETYLDYFSPSGQTSCKQQAWSAAALLRTVAPSYKNNTKFNWLKNDVLGYNKLGKVYGLRFAAISIFSRIRFLSLIENRSFPFENKIIIYSLTEKLTKRLSFSSPLQKLVSKKLTFPSSLHFPKKKLN